MDRQTDKETFHGCDVDDDDAANLTTKHGVSTTLEKKMCGPAWE